MPGNGSDLSFGALADCQSRHRCSAQIMERDTNNTSPLAGLTPRGTKAIRRPRLAVYGGEDDRRAFGRRIECSFQWRTDWDNHGTAAFGLPQPYLFAVIGRPRKAQQIALALSGP